MEQSSVGVVLYKCVVCGFACTSKKALMGHMNKHRDVEWGFLHVRLPKALVDEFLRICREHNTTSCQVLHSLLTVFNEGSKRGLVDLSTKNPVTIQLVNVFGARPRGRGKYSFVSSGVVSDVNGGSECFVCGAPAVVAAFTGGWREVLLCRRHVFLKNNFEGYRKLTV